MENNLFKKQENGTSFFVFFFLSEHLQLPHPGWLTNYTAAQHIAFTVEAMCVATSVFIQLQLFNWTQSANIKLYPVAVLHFAIYFLHSAPS